MTPEQQKELEKVKDEIQDRIESNIKDAAHWLGGWDELQKLIEVLKENEAEASFDRRNNDY
jgi:hypothetical protein